MRKEGISQMENSGIGNLMDVTISKIKEMVNVDTVVGTPIETADGVPVIPVSRVSYGFGTGGSDFPVKTASGFGGGGGAGIRIDPIGFLVIKDGNVRMINIVPPANTSVDRVIEKAPEIVDAIEELIEKFKNKDDAE